MPTIFITRLNIYMSNFQTPIYQSNENSIPGATELINFAQMNDLQDGNFNNQNS